ncbi:hypothetical protein PG993_005029 [Apiospora rasikravindrae]|uniref:Uncharacterized protein n=1 Tax=Apiospora rasikravindrae TaxID=990691 RepID=A0ABR1TGF6_9PEZI
MAHFHGRRIRSRDLGGGFRYNAEDFSVSQPAEIDFNGMDEQSQCVLFCAIPSELRTLIFEYALAPHDNLAKPYAKDRMYCRPGQLYHPKTDTSLLQTCKRVYQEARVLPVALATHTFWLFGGPWRCMKTGMKGMTRFSAWQNSMSEEQRAAVDCVQIFAQQTFLESLGTQSNNGLESLTFAARTLRITLRHTDWWSWESPPASSDRLGICPWERGRTSHQKMLSLPLEHTPEAMRELMSPGTWGWQVCQVKNLQTLEMGFEIDERKKPQLDAVLERARHWIFPMSDGDGVLRQSGVVAHSTYEGFVRNKDDSTPVLSPTGGHHSPWVDRTFHVAIMTWKRSVA